MSSSDRALFTEARDLIKQKHYHEARAILHSMSHPQAALWLEKLDQLDPPGSRPTSAAASAPTTSAYQVRVPTLEDGVLKCEHCGELEHAGMTTCQHDDCPYMLKKSRGSHPVVAIFMLLIALVVTIGGLALGAGFVGIALEGIPGGPLPIIILGAPFVLLWLLMGFTMFTNALFGLLGHSIMLFNPRNGAMSRRGILFGVQIRRRITAPLDPIEVPPGPFGGDYPISVAARPFRVSGWSHQQNKQGARMCIAAIIDLAAQGYLAIWRAETVSGFWQRKQTDYLILPGKRMGIGQPVGRFEQTLTHFVRRWPKLLTMETVYADQGPNAYMLVYLLFEHDEEWPVKELIKPVEHDAGRYEGNPNSLQAKQSRDRADAWYEQLEAQHPDLVKHLEKQIRQALSARTESSD
jgi:hypothetical protein